MRYRLAGKNLEMRKCPECDTEFETALKSQKYCSSTCRFTRQRQAYKANYVPKEYLGVHKCSECDTEFTTSTKKQKYCSVSCRHTRDNRIYNKPTKRERRSTVETVVCVGCSTEFTYKLFDNSEPRKYCTKQCFHKNRVSADLIGDYRKPTHELDGADLDVIQLIWHTFDYLPLSIFPDSHEVREIHDSLLSKEMFHEWAVYTIIFQSHMMWSYEMIVQTPGLVKFDFLRLCQKYGITLQDSEAFDEDIKTGWF